MSTLALNKKALFDYEILEKFEGGLVLSGPEVKSVKAGHVQLKGAFLYIHKGELWLKNAFIAKYEPATGVQKEYDPYQDRKVLVHTKELNRFIGKVTQEKLTLVPLSLYTKRRMIKMEFALARGKKKYEKRETIKKRDVDRQMRERLKE
ncbi:SsrA-binding protein [Candidatus Uhrbacteria bacterium RIFOXYA2_FULL_40_9]|nr:MAG: SsrA-binding protein [Candidatus Uhrbacteria bacterium GW2011_GWF2_40_263]OGL93775.1 MAG: SsrA-binding protein [Candidatus Uhrbacteria bacterium RIFOXYA2_FULL_40_9]OGL97438.1 MAG: SsrA-binding protein [Candidatus Uhrbacteria bacterium RIFOXYB2_FULL_41_18]HBK34808.1 SsrA-binding protein [Candidatus Uhrbacteria bacterium]HCB56116.1 SsrA-binding protein [Candidatus Uhrbacteria bacterium]